MNKLILMSGDSEKPNGSDEFIPTGEMNLSLDRGNEAEVDEYYEAVISKEVNLKSVIVNIVLKEFTADDFLTALCYLFESENRKKTMKREGKLSEKQFNLLDRVLRDKETDPDYFDLFQEVIEELCNLN